jgi:NTE family protein
MPLDSAEVVTDVPLADAIQASFSIPVLFKPMIHQHRVLVDGGVIDNCPVAAARALGADKVIAVDLVFADPVNTPFDSIFSVLTRVVSIGLATQMKNSAKGADIVLRPEVSSVGLLDFSQLSVCIEAGYQHARQRMDEIKEVLFATHFVGRSMPRYRHASPLPRKGGTT